MGPQRTASELVAEQAQGVLSHLPEEDRQVVMAHISELTWSREVRGGMFLITIGVIGGVTLLLGGTGFLVGFFYLLATSEMEVQARCEGWCARDTMVGRYTDRCVCEPAPDPTRVWAPEPALKDDHAAEGR